MGKFFSWLGNLIKSAIEGIIDFFWGILQGIGQFFLDCWHYLWDWVSWGFLCAIDWILSLFMGILDLLAEKVTFEIDLMPYAEIFQRVSVINAWVPLDTFFYCAGVYFTFLFIWIVYKFVKSWIPSVSGS